ncbi:major facilitator superfamily domain-containing protein [Mariannaea sp. PMI_226]|nr:major facilitator superfamily domain-containing protein [Mariannaea sp. PMI_226]
MEENRSPWREPSTQLFSTSRQASTNDRLEWSHNPSNPLNWLLWEKWTTMSVACWVTFIVGLNATSLTTASKALSSEFDLSNAVIEDSFLPSTVWNAAAAVVPLVTLPLMDTYGVRIGYVTYFILFCIFLIPQALAKDFTTLIVCRVFAGAFGGTLQNAADGIAANLFSSQSERALPLTVFVLSVLLGVTMGPVLGAAGESLGWRWIVWIQLIICGASIPLVVMFMRENRGSVIRSRLCKDVIVAEQGRVKESPLFGLARTISRSAVLLTTEPTIIFMTLWSSFTFGLIFISTQSVPLVFADIYGWSETAAGLAQVSIGIGQLFGFAVCLIQNNVYIRSAALNRKKAGTPIPESVLYLSIPGTAIALAGGLFMYGWGIFQSHWIVPTIGLSLTGFAITTIMHAATIYVTDEYAACAASAIAAVAFGENVFAAFLPLAARPMYLQLNFQWASTFLALIALLLTFAPIVLIYKGHNLINRQVLLGY